MNQTAIADVRSGISIPERIEALLLLSQEMLAAADGHEWGRLAELEARRSLAISEFFADWTEARAAGQGCPDCGFASSDCRHDSRDGGRSGPSRPSRGITPSLEGRGTTTGTWEVEQRTEQLPRAASGTAAEDTGIIRACIQRVLDLDGRVIARGETGLRALAGEIANLGQGRRAHKAYGDVGDG